MVIELSEAHIRRLSLARMILHHGLHHVVLKDQTSRMLSICHFDQANEIVLRLLADLSGEQYKEDSFNSILGSARKTYEDITKNRSLPEEKEIVELHKIRNRIQHGAMTVDSSTVDRFKQIVEKFITTVLQAVYDKTLSEISLANLVHDDELRILIKQAEQHLNRKEFKKCLGLCEETLYKATFEKGDVFSKAGMLTGYWGAKIIRRMIDKKRYVSRYRGMGRRLAGEISDAILELGRIATVMQFLDGYKGDFLLHRKAIDNLKNLSPTKLEDQAYMSLEFVISLILKWQDEGVLQSDL